MATGKTIDTVKPAKTPKASKPAKAEKPNIFARLTQYFRDVRGEMKRVVWPTRPEVINSSIVVIVTLLFFTFLILLLDSVVFKLLETIRGLG